MSETSSEKPKRKKHTVRVSRAEVDRRILWIERLFIDGIPEPQIVQMCMLPPDPGEDADGNPLPKGLGLSYTRSYVYLDRMKERLNRLSEADRPYNKARAEARLFRLIREARATKQFGAAASAELLLSKIQGTMEAVKVALSANVTTAMLQVMGRADENELNEMLEQYEELELAAGTTLEVPSQEPSTDAPTRRGRLLRAHVPAYPPPRW